MDQRRWTCLRYLGNNFGDNLNLWLCERLGVARVAAFDQPFDGGDYLLGIGTLFNSYLNPGPDARLHVFGTGAGYDAGIPSLRASVHFLRGPLSCDWLGLPRRLALCDGAYVLHRRIHDTAAGQPREFDYGLIRHQASDPARWPSTDRVLSISPEQPPADFVREVARCRKIVAECLHGAMVADMLGIPFCVVQTSPVFHSFKWLDWLQSLRLPLDIQLLDPHSAGYGRLDALRYRNSGEAHRRTLVEHAVGHADALQARIRADAGN